jgi:Asp-tRNA(Asn)/Glu-tRNA(Gln) amidotransferase A subunit family amidase
MTTNDSARPLALPLQELARLLRAGDLGAEEVVRDCLDAIREQDETIRAWVHVDAEGATAAARELDRLPATERGPLHGVPVGLKDIIDTATMPTAYGSRIYAGHRPTTDAAAAQRLRDVGAVAVGKTVTTEFASWSPTPTRNPHDPERTAGASSSGSAAAVGAGMVPLALGTQTVGSTIRPASFCGVAAIKATHGVLDLTGFKRTSARLDTMGIFASDPAGLALAWRVLQSPSGVRSRHPQPADAARIGFARTPWWEQADAASRAATEAAAEALGAAAVDLPPDFGDIVPAHDLIATTDTSYALLPEYRARPELLTVQLRERLAEGLRTKPDAYRAAVRTADRLRAATSRVFDDVDVLVAPAVIGEAPPAELGTGDPLFCRPWSMLGNPVVTVPVAVGPAGLPIGVQIVAAHGDDLLALAVASRLANAMVPEAARG